MLDTGWGVESSMGPTFVLVVIVALLAEVPADAQEITACASTKNGALRMVVAPADCNPKKETAISWNAVGPPGLDGGLLLSKGQTPLGRFVEWKGSVSVAFNPQVAALIGMNTEGHLVPPEGAGIGGAVDVGFTEPDCQGTALVENHLINFLLSVRTTSGGPVRHYVPTTTLMTGVRVLSGALVIPTEGGFHSCSPLDFVTSRIRADEVELPFALPVEGLLRVVPAEGP
jgi:hypothetical protein